MTEVMMSNNFDSPIQTSFLALSPLTSIKQAIESMAKAQTSCVFIVEDKKLLGIFTERDVVHITVKTEIINDLKLIDVMTTTVITIKMTDTENIFTLSKLFHKHKVRHLPVLNEQDQIVGVVTPQSLRNVFKPEYLLRYIRVEEVMNKKIICSFPEDSILTLAKKMVAYHISCVVIVKAKTSFPVGIVTERDIVQFHNLGLNHHTIDAQKIMSTPLFTMQPQDSLWSVHQKMQQLKVRRLVVNNSVGELAGIITQTQMLKVLDATELYQVVRQMQEVIEQQTNQLQQLNQELHIRNQELAHLSTVDELTQLVNRRKLNQFLNSQWHNLANSKQALSLIICDVDNFKLYNDTYGHLAGDKCLVKIARTLQNITRQNSDLVARYGGEEFIIVLPNTDKFGAECVAKNILTKIEELRIIHSCSTTSDYVTVSLGVAIAESGSLRLYCEADLFEIAESGLQSEIANPELTNSLKSLLKFADKLLYQSKAKGRNTYTLEVFCPKLFDENFKNRK